MTEIAWNVTFFVLGLMAGGIFGMGAMSALILNSRENEPECVWGKCPYRLRPESLA